MKRIVHHIGVDVHKETVAVEHLLVKAEWLVEFNGKWTMANGQV
jgi:hypothetical protein